MTCCFCQRTCPQDAGKMEQVKQYWYCDECWVKFARHSKAMREHLPTDWYVEGGQNWTWIKDGSAKEVSIEFDKHGQLHTPWGLGKWVLSGPDMKVSFGLPTESWQLARTPKGFRAVRQSGGKEDATYAHGWPQYGPAPDLGGASALACSALIVSLRSSVAAFAMAALARARLQRRGFRSLAVLLFAFAGLPVLLRIRSRRLGHRPLAPLARVI